MTMPSGLIILADLEDRDLIWLSQTGRLRALAEGDELIAEDCELEELFIVTDGHFRVTANGIDLAELSTGDVLGEMSFVEKRPTSASVVAMGPARVLAVSRAALTEEFTRNQGFAARFYRALAVFLSDRLRTMAAEPGQEELDESLLDTLHVAGDRTLRLIELLEGRVPAA